MMLWADPLSGTFVLSGHYNLTEIFRILLSLHEHWVRRINDEWM